MVLKYKAGKDTEHSGGMYRGVMKYLGRRAGEGPDILIEDRKALRMNDQNI